LADVEFIDENGGGPNVRLRMDRRNLGEHQYDAPLQARAAGAASSTLLTWRAGIEFIGFR
jgi:hypothetical protein